MSPTFHETGPHAADLAAHAHVAPAPLSAAPPPPAAPPPSTGRATVYGYAPYWQDAMDQDWDRLTHIAIFSVGVASDGSLTSTGNWTGVAPDVVPVAHAHGVKVDLCVTSFYDSEHAAVLPDAGRRAALVEALGRQVDAYGADGVNVDFEGLDAAYMGDFTRFVQELAARVGEVYVATPAVDWSQAYDYPALAAASDGLFIMGYGYHWTGGDPGPNDPLAASSRWGTYAIDWTVADYLSTGAPADKIILGLPLYGQEWPAGTTVPGSAWGDGWSVELDEARGIAAAEGGLWDDASATAYVLRDGTQLWFDDDAALQARMHWAVETGLQGVGFWALGYEGSDPGFWDMVAAETTWDDGGTTPVDTGDTQGTDTDTDTDTPAGQAEVHHHAEDPGGCASVPGAGWLAVTVSGLLARRRARAR
jgi:hypothetical protein